MQPEFPWPGYAHCRPLVAARGAERTKARASSIESQLTNTLHTLTHTHTLHTVGNRVYISIRASAAPAWLGYNGCRVRDTMKSEIGRDRLETQAPLPCSSSHPAVSSCLSPGQFLHPREAQSQGWNDLRACATPSPLHVLHTGSSRDGPSLRGPHPRGKLFLGWSL